MTPSCTHLVPSWTTVNGYTSAPPCGKPAVVMLPGDDPPLYFCRDHRKRAEVCFSGLVAVEKEAKA